nr:immunoglobulin light chain junction region [Macaca mulatta]MOV82075.1 immunoglobulin light chain junction region [Macaca mulatta]MOV83802.1 immunoglobulin light chain junction region [Macaca mulatta]MOV84671.1 immunoglobulin light chain junction region [Macaca mulatta]MOV86126.1 immunoglobulin light chain junction region [Macaca mulatta]
CQQDFDWPPPF